MNPSTACAQVLVDELVRGGVHEAVLCPGSRSAPLAYALLEASRRGRLRLHVRIDERGAGFLALGLAKTSGQPVVVVTTSGTAVANLHPAALEAAHAGVPLVLLTADRPAELLGVGANQTVDQVGLFAPAVGHVFAVPAAEVRSGQVAWWRSTVSRVLAAATGALSGETGPVHLNVALREPLLPTPGDPWPEDLAGRADGGPWVVAARNPGAEPELYAGDPRTLVVVGDCSPVLAARAARIVAASGWPVVAEPTGQLGARALPLQLLSIPALLEQWAPSRVLVVGRPTVSRSVTALLSRPGLVVDVLTDTAHWSDPLSVAGTALRGEIEVVGTCDQVFAAAWSQCGELVTGVVGEALAGSDLSGPLVAALLISVLDPRATLFVGSSNPIRDVAAVSWLIPPTVTMLANRGVAGIDGTVSSAVGAALGAQAQGGPQTYALMGDLTFVHDSTGLVIGPGEPRPDLCIVVVNDDGGGIFSLLEQGSAGHDADFERVFGTPHGTDLGALCAATGTPHALPADRDSLLAALAPAPGIRVVEVRLDRTARVAQQEDRDARCAAAVEAALLPQRRGRPSAERAV